MRSIETKSFPLRLDEKGVETDGTFSGYAAVYGNVDRTKDVIEVGAFKRSLDHNPQVPILHLHDPTQPIGVADLSEDGKGLRFKGKLTLDVQRAREDHALMRDGAMRHMSIGYKVHGRRFRGATRHLTEVAVKEVSPVTTGFAANPLAVIDAVKSELDVEEEELLYAIRRAKEGRRLSLDTQHKISSAAQALLALLPDGAGLADLEAGPEDGSTLPTIEEAVAIKAELDELAAAIRSR